MRCELYRKATQTVFGEGNPGAGLMLVGEEPGDREDLAGRLRAPDSQNLSRLANV